MRLTLKQAEREAPVIVSLIRSELPESSGREIQAVLDHVLNRLAAWDRSHGPLPLVRDLVAEIVG